MDQTILYFPKLLYMSSRIIVFLISFTVCISVDIDDYCSFEKFQPKCGSDEVIIMDTARYGRMSLGKSKYKTVTLYKSQNFNNACCYS